MLKRVLMSRTVKKCSEKTCGTKFAESSSTRMWKVKLIGATLCQGTEIEI